MGDITAKIVSKKDVVIDLSSIKDKRESSLIFAHRIFNSLPIGIATINRERKITYCNSIFRNNCEKIPEKVDETLIAELKKLGIDDVPLETLENEISYLFSETDDIETITLGKKEYLTILKISVKTESGKSTFALMIIRA